MLAIFGFQMTTALSAAPLKTFRRRVRAPSQARCAGNPLLAEYFRELSQALGPMHWWPARSRFEVIVGAILTQNTAWINVERAIASLRREQLLSPKAIEEVLIRRLARLIRSSGYFRQKAKKLKAFVHFL